MPLYNLKIGGTTVEKVICNGQTAEEIWLNGVQVYDGYVPADVPNGENRTYSEDVTGTYADGNKWVPLNVPIKATGSMSILISGVNTPGIQYPERGYMSAAVLSMVHPRYGEIANVAINTITNHENDDKFRRRTAKAYGGTFVIIQSGSGEIGYYATLDWDFHSQTVKINGSTYSWTPKWSSGITMQYQLNPCGYLDSNDNWVGGTMGARYSITA